MFRLLKLPLPRFFSQTYLLLTFIGRCLFSSQRACVSGSKSKINSFHYRYGETAAQLAKSRAPPKSARLAVATVVDPIGRRRPPTPPFLFDDDQSVATASYVALYRADDCSAPPHVKPPCVGEACVLFEAWVEGRSYSRSKRDPDHDNMPILEGEGGVRVFKKLPENWRNKLLDLFACRHVVSGATIHM